MTGLFELPEAVSFDSLAELRARGEAFVDASSGTAQFDLGGLQECNSAAVALLMSWFRYANAHGKTIVYTRPAEDLVNLVGVAGLDEILPFRSDGAE